MSEPLSSNSVLGIVPARSASKGIPKKNIRSLAGIPLVTRAVRAALESGVVDKVVLTTDSEEIAALGRTSGAETPFLRPPELASDETPMLPVLQHAVGHVIESDWVPGAIVLLQPSAPFRRKEDLVEILKLLSAKPELDSVVTVEPMPDHFAPHFAMKVEKNRLLPFLPDGLGVTRRQDAPQAYVRNGQYYVTRCRTLLEKDSIYGDFCLPYVTTHKAVNLDTLEDWEEAERLAGDFFAATE